MARQKGVLRYKGNLGGISHYRMKGVSDDLAKVANGPSKEQIKNDPAFKRTRENNAEFGASAKVGKSLRAGLAEVIRNYADPQVTGRITKVFKDINLKGTGARGRRSIKLSLHRDMLENFEFNKNTAFGSIFNASWGITPNAGRNESTLALSAFNPLDKLNIPAGATHFRVLNGLAVVSDFNYNNTSKKFEVASTALDQLSAYTYSTYLPIDSSVTTTNIVAALSGSPAMSTDVSVVNVIGIEFYQFVDGEYYMFSSGNAMRVGKVF
jgi:hypothetical protein